MDERVRRLSDLVQGYDRDLYAFRASNGMLQIHRKANRLEASDYNQEEPQLAHLNPQFILALTDTWTLDGQPVEWGLEPLMCKLKEMDSWRSDTEIKGLRRKRERAKEIQANSKRNESRAMAADLRRDFAKATNEINTSTLEKVDSRRKADGYCK